MSLQQQIIAELKVKPSINEEEEVRKRVDFLKTYVKNAGAKGLLIAISGGIDSAVATALAKKQRTSLRKRTTKSTKRLVCSNLMVNNPISTTATL